MLCGQLAVGGYKRERSTIQWVGRGELSHSIVVYGILILGTACHCCSYVGFSVTSYTAACNVYVSFTLHSHFCERQNRSVKVFRNDDQLNGVVNSGKYEMPTEVMEQPMWRQYETKVMLG